MIQIHTISLIVLVCVGVLFGLIAGMALPGRMYVGLFRQRERSDRNEHGYPDWEGGQ